MSSDKVLNYVRIMILVLSLVTTGHKDGGGHLSHAWKVTPGASVGFQTRSTKGEGEAMCRCC